MHGQLAHSFMHCCRDNGLVELSEANWYAEVCIDADQALPLYNRAIDECCGARREAMQMMTVLMTRWYPTACSERTCLKYRQMSAELWGHDGDGCMDVVRQWSFGELRPLIPAVANISDALRRSKNAILSWGTTASWDKMLLLALVSRIALLSSRGTSSS